MQTRGLDVAADLLDSLPDPVIGCNREGAVVYWSHAAEEMYGYAADEALGRRAATLLHTRFPSPLLEINEELEDLGRWQGRLEHRRKDGTTLSVHSRWVARRDDRGTWVGSFAIERELGGITGGPAPEPPAPPDASAPPAGSAPPDASAPPDGSAAPEAARPHGAAAPPGATAASPRELAHELNNALAVIMNFSAFVIAELDAPTGASPEAMRADLQEIQAAAERALALARRMLDGG